MAANSLINLQPKLRMIIYFKQLLTAFFWGGTFIAGRIVAKGIDPFAAAFIRFTIASVILLLAIRVLEGKLPGLNKRQFFSVVCLGLTGIFTYNILFFQGLQTVQAGRASLIIALNPIIISLFSSLIYKEKLTLLKLVGILVSVLGAVVVITYGDLSSIFTNPLSRGDLYIFGCVASWVAYSLIGKSVLSGLSPLVSVGYSATIGTVLLAVPAIVRGLFQEISSYQLDQWGSLFYLGFFGTVLGFFFYYEGIEKIGPTKAGVFINFVPVSAIILAFLILNEPITWSLALGAVLVICGVLLTNFSSAFLIYLRKRSS